VRGPTSPGRQNSPHGNQSIYTAVSYVVLQREKLSCGHYFRNDARTEEGTFGRNFITVHSDF
jgi:hypothetical protein